MPSGPARLAKVTVNSFGLPVSVASCDSCCWWVRAESGPPFSQSIGSSACWGTSTDCPSANSTVYRIVPITNDDETASPSFSILLNPQIEPTEPGRQLIGMPPASATRTLSPQVNRLSLIGGPRAVAKASRRHSFALECAHVEQEPSDRREYLACGPHPRVPRSGSPQRPSPGSRRRLGC